MVHEHHFGQDEPKAGEARTKVVVILTAGTMVVEVMAGLAYGSMALLADGLHMASHASALGLALMIGATFTIPQLSACDCRDHGHRSAKRGLRAINTIQQL